MRPIVDGLKGARTRRARIQIRDTESTGRRDQIMCARLSKAAYYGEPTPLLWVGSATRGAPPRAALSGPLLMFEVMRAVRGPRSTEGHRNGRPMTTRNVAPPDAQVHETVLEPRTGWRSLGIGELWGRRELLYFFVWRDLKVRYKQTAFGAAWAVLQPLLLMAVFSVTVGRLPNVGPPGVPYPLFVFVGLVPWTLFASSLVAASNSLVASEGIITKVYFPRLLLPVAATGSYLVDFLVSFSPCLRCFCCTTGSICSLGRCYAFLPSSPWKWRLPWA